MRPLDDALIKEKEFARIVSGLVMDIDVTGEVRRLAAVGPPTVVAPAAWFRQENCLIV